MIFRDEEERLEAWVRLLKTQITVCELRDGIKECSREEGVYVKMGGKAIPWLLERSCNHKKQLL